MNVARCLKTLQTPSPISLFSTLERAAVVTFVITLFWLYLIVLPLWYVSINNMVWFYLFLNFMHRNQLACFLSFYVFGSTLFESRLLQTVASVFTDTWSSFILTSQFFYPFFAEGYLAYFQFWVIASNSTLNILAYIILVYTYMSFSRTHVVVELLNCNLCTSSTVVNNARMSSEATISIYITPSSPKVFETSHYYTVVQALSHVRPFVTPWTAARQAPLSAAVS